MAKRAKNQQKISVLTADQIGEVEAMQIAAIRGLKLRDVGVEENLKNRIEFIKIKREVRKMPKSMKAVDKLS